MHHSNSICVCQTNPLHVIIYKLHGYYITAFICVTVNVFCYRYQYVCTSRAAQTLTFPWALWRAETFIDSLIHREDGWDSQRVVLTTKIPNTLSWTVSHSL